MRGQVPAPTGLDARPFYNGNAAKDYAAMSAFALNVGDEWRARNGAQQLPAELGAPGPALRRGRRHAVPAGRDQPDQRKDQVGLRHAALQA
jgi:hypothetical protein